MPRKAPKRKIKAYSDPHLDNLAVILGYICIQWSRVEEVLDFAIGAYLGFEEGNLTNSVTSNLDIRNKIQTLKALAFERKTNDGWFSDLAKHLDYIDNTLRPERNRYVHSHWKRPKGKLTRISRRIRFSKPQAFAELSLSTEERSTINLREAQHFCVRLEKAFIKLFLLCIVPTARGGPQNTSLPKPAE